MRPPLSSRCWILLALSLLFAVGLSSQIEPETTTVAASSSEEALPSAAAEQVTSEEEPTPTVGHDDGQQQQHHHRAGSHHTVWSYANQASWAHQFPACVGENRRQSPIDIDTETVVLRPKWNLEFIDYDQFVEFQYKNTHHSVSAIPLPSVAKPSVRLSWFPSDLFELQEIHFHWGDGINKGSEHEINDQKAAAEVSALSQSLKLEVQS